MILRLPVFWSRLIALHLVCLCLPWTKAAALPAASESVPLQWTEVAAGVWKATAGSEESLTLLGAAGQPPKLSALAAMSAAPFPFAGKGVVAQRVGSRMVLRFPLGREESVYGLGVDFKGLRRNGTTFQLHVDHWGGRAGRTHAPVPFYVSTQGYGVLIDSARYISYHVGIGVRLDASDKPAAVDRTTQGNDWTDLPRSDAVEASLIGPGAAIYVFAGPTPLDAVRRYNLFCGGGALPPKWGLGYLARTPLAYSAQQVLGDVDEFRRRGIPLDMVGLEPGWHDKAYPCSFEWDGKRFPNPGGFLAEMKRRHVRVNLWFNPYVAPASPLHTKLAPYAASHLVWNGIVPDYSLPEARAIFAEHLRSRVLSADPSMLMGFKVDEVDGGDQWLWPDHALFPSGNDGEQMRQVYGLLVQRILHEHFRAQNRRSYGQVRGTNAGASPFPFVIYNDNYDFSEYITAVANSSFAGVLWSPEVRGGSGLDMLRRTQAVCFSPLALFNGWETSKKLWSDEKYLGAMGDAIALRLRLLPYWYSAFAEYSQKGTPVIRAMPLVPGFRATLPPGKRGQVDLHTNPYANVKLEEVKDQYLVGDALLVAPIASNVTSRKVSLPPGRWYDFYTGKCVGENQVIEVTPPLDQIPLFVRDGGIIPLIPAREWMVEENEIVPLEIRHYGEKPGEYLLYDDDGVTFDHEKGAYSWTKLSASRGPDGSWKGEVATPQKGLPWHYSATTWRFMSAPVARP